MEGLKVNEARTPLSREWQISHGMTRDILLAITLHVLQAIDQTATKEDQAGQTARFYNVLMVE